MVGFPLLVAALAGLLEGTRWWAFLYYGAVVSLAVMLVESLVEVRRNREQANRELDANGSTVARLRDQLAAEEQKLAEQELELAKATNDRRLAELLRYIGESSPTIAEMCLDGPQNLDGWFRLIASRIQKASTSGYAGIALLREQVDWFEGDFIVSYEVMFSGGSGVLKFEPGTLFPAVDTAEAVLIAETGVGSAYVSEFTLAEQPYWVCILLSTTARHAYLGTVSRALIAPVLAALAPSPPEPRRPRLREEPPEHRDLNS